jgi:hypothetical protein
MENVNEKTPEKDYHEQAVRDCIKDADLVISGKVSQIDKVEYGKGHRISRHDPKWNEVTIQIDDVEKGSHQGKKVKVFFPQSTYVSWYKTPKLNIGDEATYVLHKEKIPQLDGVEAYTILHQADVHSKDNIDQIKKFVSES